MKLNFLCRPDPPKAINIDLGNVGAILAALLPLARKDYRGNSDPSRVQFMVYGDGSMELSIEVDVGCRLIGRGSGVDACVADLRERSIAVARALPAGSPTLLRETE